MLSPALVKPIPEATLRLLRVTLVVLLLVLTVAVMRVTLVVSLPVALAFFILMLTQPLQQGLLQATTEWAHKLRRYVLGRTAVSALSGVAVSGFPWAIGLDMPVVWGAADLPAQFHSHARLQRGRGASGAGGVHAATRLDGYHHAGRPDQHPAPDRQLPQPPAGRPHPGSAALRACFCG